MAVVPTQLVTVEEFRKLPEDSGPVYHELRHGEGVSVARPKYKHYTIQRRIRRLLDQLQPPGGLVDIEFAFRPVAEHELRVADVAYVRAERERSIDSEDHLTGAPDIVIDILSPSNTAAEVYEKEKLCLEHGAEKFWVVDPDRHQVKVSTPDGHTITYQSCQEIPLPLFGGVKVGVDEILG